MRDVPPGYDPSQYERPSVTVDVLVYTLRNEDLQVLLVRRKNPPFAGYWAIPGGFVGMNESLEEAALRELEEETGIRDACVEQLHTFGEPKRDPRTRVITVAFLALVPETALPPISAGDDAADVRWWPVYSLPDLAFDHAQILNYALTRLRHNLEYTIVRLELLPEKFTLSGLQAAYESILGEKMDRGKFRKKLRKANAIEPTRDHCLAGDRPARLYRFREDIVAKTRAQRRMP